MLRPVLSRQYEALDKREEGKERNIASLSANRNQLSPDERLEERNNNLSTGVIFLFSSLSLVFHSDLLPETRLSDPNNACCITT